MYYCIPLCTLINIQMQPLKFKLYLFYNAYKTSYTTYINHAHWQDVCIGMVFVWEETGVPAGNPPVWLDVQMTISRTDAGYRTCVAAWEASSLTLRQPDSPNATLRMHLYTTCILKRCSLPLAATQSMLHPLVYEPADCFISTPSVTPCIKDWYTCAVLPLVSYHT